MSNRYIKSLNSLRKIADHELEEQRRELGIFKAKRAQLEERLVLLEQQLSAQKQIAAKRHDLAGVMGELLGNYLAEAQRRIGLARVALRDADEALAAAEILTVKGWQEMRKYEILIDRNLKAARREMDLLDEKNASELASQANRRLSKQATNKDQ